MTGREYLRKIWAVPIQLKTLTNEERRIREDIISVSALDYSLPRVSGGGLHHDTGDKISRLMEAKEKVNQEWDEWIHLQTEAKRLIYKLPDYWQQAILLERYLHHHSWDDVADLVGYSRARTMQLHAKALDAFDKIYAQLQD